MSEGLGISLIPFFMLHIHSRDVSICKYFKGMLILLDLSFFRTCDLLYIYNYNTIDKSIKNNIER